MREAPPEHGTLELIVVRPEVDEREVLDEAELRAGAGVVGDRWHVGRSGGRSAEPEGRDHPHVRAGCRARRGRA